jgi:hypothetical protein
MPPKCHYIQLAKENEMKLQMLDEGLDSNRGGETISFFNELDTETRNILVTSVSFFNEVATEMKKLSSKPLFHFLTRLPQRHKKLSSEPPFLIMDSKRTMLRKDTMSKEKTRSWLPRDLH